MPPWQDYDSSDKGSWHSDSWKDGSSSSNTWQSDYGHWMYANEEAAEGWGVRPPLRAPSIRSVGLGSQQQWACRPQQQLACQPLQQLAFLPLQRLECPLCAQTIPENQPVTQDYQSVYEARYKAGYDAACEDWEKRLPRGGDRCAPDAGEGARPRESDQPQKATSSLAGRG